MLLRRFLFLKKIVGNITEQELMSIKTFNNLRSWVTLAPKEIAIGETKKQPLLWSLKADMDNLFAVEFVDGKLSEPDQDELLPHLLRCIEARGWQSHLYTNELGVSTCKIVSGDYEFTSSDKLGSRFVPKTGSRSEVILYAYVKALAAQRKIAGGSIWQHFKGDRIDMKCQAPWCLWKKDSSQENKSFGMWAIEEEPEKGAQLWLENNAWLYNTERISLTGDRVFYTHNGKGFARLKDDFLGVVGPEYPEMEGCLRFLEVVQ